MSEERFDALDLLEMYERIAEAWKAAQLSRELGYRELVYIPVVDELSPIGAIFFLSVLLYPESNTRRDKFRNALMAHGFKSNTKPRTPERQKLRKTDEIASLIDTPNKRIAQTLDAGLKRLHLRLRAAWVLSKKLISNPNPAHQDALSEIMLEAATHNSRNYPAFFSEQGDDEQIISSFRRNVMATTRPVAHLAFTLHLYFVQNKMTKVSLLDLVENAPCWLAEAVETAEKFRVSWGDLFPSLESSHHPSRVKNYYVAPSEMIAVLPHAGPKPDIS
jgi:hypothetical protein